MIPSRPDPGGAEPRRRHRRRDPGARGRRRRGGAGPDADRQCPRRQRLLARSGRAIWPCSARSPGCRPRSTTAAIAFPPEVLAEAPEVADNERHALRLAPAGAAVELDILRSQAEQRGQELNELKTHARASSTRSLALAQQELDIIARWRRSGWSPRSTFCGCSARSTICRASSSSARLAVPRVGVGRGRGQQADRQAPARPSGPRRSVT